MEKRFAALAATALFCSACMHDPGSEKTWYGLARRSCGPTDGPAVQIVLDTLPYADCSASHAGQIELYFPYANFDSLKAGVKFSVAPEPCAACLPTTTASYSIDVKSVDSAGIHADFDYLRKTNGAPDFHPQGAAALKSCDAKPMPLCG